MAAPRVDRRLAAIMAVDAVGYSRLMATDEAGTVARLKTLRREFIEPTIAEHHGRIVKVTGDGALVEFPSVVDAVCCAIELQRGTTERARNVPQDRQIRFRIGINLGDIIIEDDDLHGDGVNIAVRLEALAEPGGICISRTVRDHVQDKLGLALKDLGKLTLKNIPRPVHVFRVLPESAAMGGRSRVGPINPRRLWAAAAAVVVLLIAGGGARLWLHSDDGGTVPRQQAGTPTMPSEAYGGTAQVALDKYRIAVLPFVNISFDPEDEYFSDGVTEELISKLSRLHGLTVIARTSIMRYKGTEKSIAEIGRELQAGTILEGSVRKAGERLRITAQLVDVESEGHLWSQDYDRKLEDVFAIQSDVAEHVAQGLQITLKPAEKTQLAKAGTDDLEAYNAYLKGLYHYNAWSKEGLETSIEYFEQAIARAPDFAKAYAAMAFSYEILTEFGYLPPDEGFPKVKETARRALEIDASTAEAYIALAAAAGYYDYDWERANESYTRALELNPNSVAAHGWYGISYLSPMGRHEEAIAHGQRAKELDPLTPYIRSDLGWSYLLARRYDEAIAECAQIPDIDPNFYFGHWCIGFAYLQKGRFEEAVAAYERAVDLEPNDLHLRSSLALTYAAAGEKARADEIFDDIEEQRQREYVSPLALSTAYMAVGDLNSTFAWLDKMYEEHHPWLIFMNVQPRYDRLRSDPRFQHLLRKIGFTEAQIDAANALAGKRG